MLLGLILIAFSIAVVFLFEVTNTSLFGNVYVPGWYTLLKCFSFVVLLPLGIYLVIAG